VRWYFIRHNGNSEAPVVSEMVLYKSQWGNSDAPVVSEMVLYKAQW